MDSAGRSDDAAQVETTLLVFQIVGVISGGSLEDRLAAFQARALTWVIGLTSRKICTSLVTSNGLVT